MHRFWRQLGPILASKIGPRGAEEPSKMHSNLYLIFDTLLDRFFVDFGSNFDPLKPPKSLKNKLFFNDFGIFAGYCFHCSWKPTWLHFGVVLPPKLEPNWHQNALKTDPTTHQKNDHILDRLRTDFGSILAPNLAPDWGNQRLFFRLMLALGAILGPRWPPRPA